jgi:hypothetical protein
MFEAMAQSDWAYQSIPTLDVDRRKYCVSLLWNSLLAEKSIGAVIEMKCRQATNIDHLNCSFTDSGLNDLDIDKRSGGEWMMGPDDLDTVV